MALRYTIGLRNLDGIPTTTLPIVVAGVMPTRTLRLQALRLARDKFLKRGYTVRGLDDLGVIRVRSTTDDLTK